MSISIQNSTATPPVRPAEVAAPRVQAPTQEAKVPVADATSQVKTQDAAQQRDELRQALERLNEQMRKQGRNLSFSMDERINRTIVQVKDANTGELVRQIPDETVLRVSRSIEDLKGLLMNEKT